MYVQSLAAFGRREIELAENVYIQFPDVSLSEDPTNILTGNAS